MGAELPKYWYTELWSPHPTNPFCIFQKMTNGVNPELVDFSFAACKFGLFSWYLCFVVLSLNCCAALFICYSELCYQNALLLSCNWFVLIKWPVFEVVILSLHQIMLKVLSYGGIIFNIRQIQLTTCSDSITTIAISLVLAGQLNI